MRPFRQHWTSFSVKTTNMSLKEDVISNRGNLKGVIFILFFRLSHFFQCHGILLKIIGIPIRLLYKVIIRWCFGIDIPDQVKISSGFQVYHGMVLVIHTDCIIGENVLLRHTTTIGQKYADGKVPVIGNNVDIGAHSIVLGDIRIGHNSVIGAGTFVDKNIPDNSVAYGSPLVIKQKKATI